MYLSPLNINHTLYGKLKIYLKKMFFVVVVHNKFRKVFFGFCNSISKFHFFVVVAVVVGFYTNSEGNTTAIFAQNASVFIKSARR